MGIKTILTILTFILTINLTAQNSTKIDSLKVCMTVTDFFDWYMGAIKQNKNSEFEPTFIENEKGMTTLNFTEYVANLKKYNFSDSLIIKEKQSYRQCIDNLEKVKYSDFETKFDDLESIEKIDCDFGNYHRWTGGQEPIDGIRIIKVQFINTTSSIITLEYFNYNSADKKNDYWGNNFVSLVKIGNVWKIDNIKWK